MFVQKSPSARTSSLPPQKKKYRLSWTSTHSRRQNIGTSSSLDSRNLVATEGLVLWHAAKKVQYLQAADFCLG